MIQRIQTIYMIIVVLVSLALPFFFSLYTVNNYPIYTYSDDIISSLLFGLSAVLAVVAIFSYRKRQNQFVLNRLNIILNLTLLGVFVYRVLTASGENEISEKGVGMILPFISIVFLFLANKAIKRDEDLVKSADRLR